MAAPNQVGSFILSFTTGSPGCTSPTADVVLVQLDVSSAWEFFNAKELTLIVHPTYLHLVL